MDPLEFKIAEMVLVSKLSRCGEKDFPLVLYAYAGWRDELVDSLIRVGVETKEHKRIYLSRPVLFGQAPDLFRHVADFLDKRKYEWDIDFDTRGIQPDVKDLMNYSELEEVYRLDGINQEFDEAADLDKKELERGLDLNFV